MMEKTPQKSSYLTGQFLIAMPQMKDPRFKEAVILICGHDEQGAMGIVLNKLIETVQFDDLVKQLDLSVDPEDVPPLNVHYGGPVEIGRGFVLHSTEYPSQNSVFVTDEIALAASTTILHDVIHGQGPRHVLLALGYAGWSTGQLEEEIMQNGWLTLSSSLENVFYKEPETLWHTILISNGIDPTFLSTQAGHA